MPLHAFTVGNYRSFVDPLRLELRPLTLLFGYNDAGKSALGRLLPLLRDSISNRPGTPINLASPAARSGSFADLRSRLSSSRGSELGLEWKDKRNPCVFNIALQDLPERRQHVVLNFEIVTEDKVKVRGEWGLPDESQTDLPNIYHLTTSEHQSSDVQITWTGLLPRFGELDETAPLEAVGTLHKHLEELLSTEWIGAIRQPPSRIRLIPDAPPAAIGADGEGAADLLAWDTATGGGLSEKVSQWFQDNTGSPLSVKLEGRVYSLVVGRAEVNVLDTGEGLAQVLPVLVAAAMAERQARQQQGNFHLVLEQPELHLHPAAHAPLADWLCRIASSETAPRMLIETHSENFLFGVQLAVAKRELPPDHVQIYWVRQEQGRSMVSHIAIDEWGRLTGWPREVFTEETDLARQLLEERRKRGYR